MFIKYGEKTHLENLYLKGEMFFNTCDNFHKYELNQAKGIGDKYDSYLRFFLENLKIYSSKNQNNYFKNQNLNFICKQCHNIPIFCIKQTNSAFLTKDQYENLTKEFPKHTHALIIKDENAFLENVRYRFKNKAFAHKVFYKQHLTLDIVNFLCNGLSDINFYVPTASKHKYFFYTEVRDRNDILEKSFYINKSNVFKTMFVKDEIFSSQEEYRIVLPYETITQGTIFHISPFNAKIVELNKLIK